MTTSSPRPHSGSVATLRIMRALVPTLLAGMAVGADATAAASATPAAAADTGFVFHDGDRPIIFIGDSITEQRMYTTLVETFVLSRYPAWKVTFRNVGWSGDTSWLQMRGDFNTALKRDFLDLKPMAATIDYGMNDARSAQWTFPRYGECLTTITDALEKQGARVALVTASPEERYEADQPAGSAYNRTLDKYAAAAHDVAMANHATFVDQFHPLIDAITAGRAAKVLGANGDPRLIPDGIHPNWAGHLLMASAILRGLHAPGLVDTCTIDAATATVTAQEGCTVEMTATPASATPAATAPSAGAKHTHLSFVRHDAALPWPIPKDADPALAIPGVAPLDGLCSYRLTVANLPANQYEVTVDGEQVAVKSATDLAAGIDLIRMGGPIGRQAAQLLQAVIDKNNTFYTRWRQVQLWQSPDWLKVDAEASRQAELARLDAKIVEEEAAIDALRLPVAHTYDVSPLPPPRPVALTATAAGNGVTLAWHAQAAASAVPVKGTIIERAAAADGPYSDVAHVAEGISTFASLDGMEAFWRVRAMGADAVSTPSLTASAAWTGGLLGAYFTGEDFAKYVGERVDPLIDADWSATAPMAATGLSEYSVRWTGTIKPPTSGAYTFSATTDDGVRVWLDGAQVIDQWKAQAPTTVTATTTLTASVPVEIVMEYFQATGGAVARLEWTGPDGVKAVVPTTAMTPGRFNPGR